MVSGMWVHLSPQEQGLSQAWAPHRPQAPRGLDRPHLTPKVTSEDKVRITTRREEHKQDSRQQQPQTRSHSHGQEAACGEALPTLTQVSPVLPDHFPDHALYFTSRASGSASPTMPCSLARAASTPFRHHPPCSPLLDISSVQDATSSRNPFLTAPTQTHLPSPAFQPSQPVHKARMRLGRELILPSYWPAFIEHLLCACPEGAPTLEPD